MDLRTFVARRRAQFAIPIEISDVVHDGGLHEFAFCQSCWEQVPVLIQIVSDGRVVTCFQCGLRLHDPYWIDRSAWEALGWHLCTFACHNDVVSLEH